MLSLPLRQLRKNDAEQDQDAPDNGFAGEGLVQKHDAKRRRDHGVQRAEHARPLGGGAALRHRLQGKAEARAYRGQHHDPKPFHASARQPGRFRQKARRKAERADHADLDDTGRERVDPAVA